MRRTTRAFAPFLLTTVHFAWPIAAQAAPGDTELVSQHYRAATSYQALYTHAISGNGNFVLFSSASTAFVPPNDTSTGLTNLFVRDRSGGQTVLANRSTTGRLVHAGSPDMSEDGRYVVFQSSDDQVVANDTNQGNDIFLRDLQAGTTELVSISSAGKQYDWVLDPDVSADGRYVAFWGAGYMIYLRDRLTRQTYQRYVAGLRGAVRTSDDGRYLAYSNYDRLLVLDRSTGRTELVNVNAAGQRANDHCYLTDISADGRFVLFVSRASNLVPGGTVGSYDVYLRDRVLHRTERVSVTSEEKPFPGTVPSYEKSRMSRDGRFVVFSVLTRSVPGRAVYDVFRRDRAKGTTWLATANSAGVKANGTSHSPLVSDDGRFVAFTSEATNLSPLDGDANPDAYAHQFYVAPL